MVGTIDDTAGLNVTLADTLVTSIYNTKGNYWTPVTGDNTPLIQAALDDLGTVSGTVFLPAKTMNVASTINIRQNHGLVGRGKEQTVLNYTGTSGSVIYVDGVNHYMWGAMIRDLRLNANNCTGINLTANASGGVITASLFQSIVIENPLYGIYINPLGNANEVYANKFSDINILYVNAPGAGIYNTTGGSYNVFDSIFVIMKTSNPKGHAINVALTNCSFYGVATDGAISSNGPNCSFHDVAIEGLFSANCPVAAPNDYAFRLAGAGNHIDLLSITTSTPTYGLTVFNEGQYINNVRGYGTPNPQYLFSPSSSSRGVATSIFGSSGSWSHLNSITTWDFFDVNRVSRFHTA